MPVVSPSTVENSAVPELEAGLMVMAWLLKPSPLMVNCTCATMPPGLPPPPGLEGRSLVPLLNNPCAEWNHPAFTVWSEDGKTYHGVAVRTERWRYAEFFGPGAGAFLTDPINDPHELVNLVGDPRYTDVVARLSALARAHVAGKTEPTP